MQHTRNVPPQAPGLVSVTQAQGRIQQFAGGGQVILAETAQPGGLFGVVADKGQQGGAVFLHGCDLFVGYFVQPAPAGMQVTQKVCAVLLQALGFGQFGPGCGVGRRVRGRRHITRLVPVHGLPVGADDHTGQRPRGQGALQFPDGPGNRLPRAAGHFGYRADPVPGAAQVRPQAGVKPVPPGADDPHDRKAQSDGNKAGGEHGQGRIFGLCNAQRRGPRRRQNAHHQRRDAEAGGKDPAANSHAKPAVLVVVFQFSVQQAAPVGKRLGLVVQAAGTQGVAHRLYGVGQAAQHPRAQFPPGAGQIAHSLAERAVHIGDAGVFLTGALRVLLIGVTCWHE